MSPPWETHLEIFNTESSMGLLIFYCKIALA